MRSLQSLSAICIPLRYISFLRSSFSTRCVRSHTATVLPNLVEFVLEFIAFAQIFPRSQPMRESNTSIYQLVRCCEEGKAAENSQERKIRSHQIGAKFPVV
jgi:hypothetical protein